MIWAPLVVMEQTVVGNPFSLDNGRWLMGGDDGEDERGGGLYGGWCSGLLFLGVIDDAARGGDGGTGSGIGRTVVMGKLARSGDDMGSSCGDGATVVGNPFASDNRRWLMGGDGAW
ncbi:hypothetical protein Dimus_031485 [Dionaea muscipula]